MGVRQALHGSRIATPDGVQNGRVLGYEVLAPLFVGRVELDVAIASVA